MAWDDEYNQDPDKLYGSSEDLWTRVGLIVVPIAFLYVSVKLLKFLASPDPYFTAITDFFMTSYQYFFN